MSKVACLLDELDGLSFDQAGWNGYHRGIYKKDSTKDNDLVKELCERLQTIDVKEYSLEMQIRWRDHQIAGAKQVQFGIARIRDTEAREAALQKLTAYERKLLGVE